MERGLEVMMKFILRVPGEICDVEALSTKKKESVGIFLVARRTLKKAAFSLLLFAGMKLFWKSRQLLKGRKLVLYFFNMSSVH